MIDFRDQILVHHLFSEVTILRVDMLSQASPKDIEDLAAAGRLAHTCPYFGSRRAIPQAEVIPSPQFPPLPLSTSFYYS